MILMPLKKKSCLRIPLADIQSRMITESKEISEWVQVFSIGIELTKRKIKDNLKKLLAKTIHMMKMRIEMRMKAIRFLMIMVITTNKKSSYTPSETNESLKVTAGLKGDEMDNRSLGRIRTEVLTILELII